jgi:ribosomal protein S18 acetylase RimI-like enzyme
VRRATPEDADEIARIQVETWRVAYAHAFPAAYLTGLSVDERRLRWAQTLADGVNDVFVAERGGAVAGFVSSGASEDEDEQAAPGELYALYVEPAAWRQGLGRELLGQAEQALRTAGFHEASLWVLEDNPRTRRFYEAAGWAPDGARKLLTRGGTNAPTVRYRKRL